jgi:hypothetical protein
MKRVIQYGGVLTVAAIVTATLVYSNSASTQTLPAPSTVRILETTYMPVGVSTIGNTGSVAWFIETNSSKERRPIACVAVSGNVECKRGTFPQP